MNIANILLPTLLTSITLSVVATSCRADPPVTGMLTLLGQQSVARTPEASGVAQAAAAAATTLLSGERIEGPPVHVCWKLSRADVMYLYRNEAALTSMFQSSSGRDMAARLGKMQKGEMVTMARENMSLADPARGGVDRPQRPVHVPLSFSFFSDRDGTHWAGVQIGGRQFVGQARRPRKARRRQRIVNNAANYDSIPLVQGIVDGIYEDKKDEYIAKIQGKIHQHTSEMGMGRNQVLINADHPIEYGELVIQVDGKVVWREPNHVVWNWFEQAQAKDFSFIEAEVRKVIDSRAR